MSQERPSPDPKRSILRRLWLRMMATAGISAAVLLSWWWKIDERRNVADLPRIPFGETVALGRSTLVPLALELTDRHDILLRARIENVTGESQTDPFGNPARPPVLLLDGAELPPPRVVLLRDDEDLSQLQPRLPEDIALIWTPPAGWSGGPAEIRFMRQTFKLRDNFYGKASWLGFAPAAKLTAEPTATPEPRP